MRPVRSATPLVGPVALVAAVALAGGCTDLRDFRGTWRGARVGSDPALSVGALGDNTAELTISTLDRHGLDGHLRVLGQPGAGTFDTPLVSLAGAEADVLAGMTFEGAPLRVYLAFVPPSAGESALAVVSLYDDSRVELRLLRGGALPLYGIFPLRRDDDLGLAAGSAPSASQPLSPEARR